VGVGAAFAQLELLRFGALADEQMLPFLASFGIGGIVLALVGDALGGILAGRSGGLYVAGLLVPLVGFVAFVPLNARGLPNVYLLVTDTTRADHLSLYGYERSTTPFLEHFASQSIVFTNAVSQGSHTIVSTPSILTSRYPSEHGMSRYAEVLPEGLTLLSEYLKASGYRTYAYATNPHLAPDRGYARGFDAYQYDGRWRHTPAATVNGRFLQWLDAQEAGPVFAFLFYVDSHSPYTPPEAYARQFDPDWVGEPVTRWDKEWGSPSDSPDRLQNLVAQYDGSIAYWDAQLKRLVGALRARGDFENAIFVYTSDHGEEFFEHGNWGHNRTLFEESIHVPLVISLPVPIHFPRLARISRLVPGVASSVDILPTILDYVGLEADPEVRGRSVAPLALGVEGADSGRSAYTEEILESYGPYDVRAVRTRDGKYIRILDYEGDRTPRDLFFDLGADPDELDNLLDTGEGESAVHRKMLESKLDEMAVLESPKNNEIPIDPRRLEALKAIGYVGASAR
jgi:arylsulfatase A-like enzyme